jgi:membrane-associated protease RseP (regulator of RpoE activity)
MHAVMAFLLLWGLLVFVGTSAQDVVMVEAFSPLAHGLDPARAAGLRAGDVIKRVDGKTITTNGQVSKAISGAAGRPVRVEVERQRHRVTIVVTPHLAKGSSVSCPGGLSACIGVQVGGGPNVRSSPFVAIGRAVVDLGRQISASVAALGSVFSIHGISSYLHDLSSSKAADQAARSGNRIESIVGAARTATQGAQAGAGQLLEVLIAINVFIGMLNLLPMLPLDGGHVAVAVYERIRSRRGRRYRADVNKLLPLVYAFVLFLGFIFVTSLYLDIAHPVKNPF